MPRLPRFVAFIVPLLFLCSCGQDYPKPNVPSACGKKSAVIGVRDGAIMRVCGCDEGVGSTVAGSSLTCTVPAGTSVIFDYSTAQLFHQIVPNGTPGFTPSPVSNPSSQPRVVSHVIKIESVATYAFKDQFEPALAGRLIGR